MPRGKRKIKLIPELDPRLPLEPRGPSTPSSPLLSLREEKEAIKLELMRRAGLASLTFFMTNILGYPPLDKVHEEVAAFLDLVHSSTHRGLLLLPRGHLKSTTVTVSYVIWRLVKEPNLRVLITNASLDNSKGFLREIKQHFEKCELLRKLYGDFANQDEKWSESQIIVKRRHKVLKEPSIQATSTDKSVVSQHYDLIVGDDIVNRETINTAEQRWKSITYYRDLLDLIEPTGDIFFIGTRWHFNDLYGHIIEENETKKTFYIMKRTVWLDKEKRIPLFRKFTPEYIDSLRLEKGPYEFACQYENNPIDNETADFQRDWINRFTMRDLEYVPYQIFITCDPAVTKGEQSNSSGFVVNAVTAENKWYILKAYKLLTNPTELLDELFSLQRLYAHRLKAFGIEKGILEETLQPALHAWEKEKGRRLFLQPIAHAKRHKEDRIRALIPKMERGEVYFSEYCDDLIEQITSFPRSNEDDVLDSLAYQLDLATPFGILPIGVNRAKMTRKPILPKFANNI